MRAIPPPLRIAVAALGVTLLALLPLYLARSAMTVRWQRLSPGAEFAIVNGEPWCRRGPSRVAVVRVDPTRVRLRLHHFRQLPAAQPLPIAEWQRATGALAVFNAGQFYEDWSYMGLLVSGGQVISGTTHPGFRAALVAEPRRGPRTAHVLDLDREPLRPDSLPWNEVAQSFMLFDRDGAVRVRRSDRVANRTVVGEDRRGRILVLTSEGGYTLHDFADLLRTAPLGLVQAMSMDGGAEAQLCVRAGSFRYASFGRWQDDTDVTEPFARTPLPTVVGIYPP